MFLFLLVFRPMEVLEYAMSCLFCWNSANAKRKRAKFRHRRGVIKESLRNIELLIFVIAAVLMPAEYIPTKYVNVFLQF